MTKEQKKELEIQLTCYMLEKHTQDECAGFIDGFEKALTLFASSSSLSLETIVDYVTKKDLSVHKKICNLWLKAGNKAEDFPKLPPCWMDVEITLKNGKKYKSMLASINNWGGVQFVINRMFKERIYLETEEVVSWEFI
jgi:hypothetical protein